MYIIEQVEMDSDGNYSMQNFQNRIPLGKPKQMTFLADMSVKGGGGQNTCPLRKCKFCREKIEISLNVRICTMQTFTYFFCKGVC